MSKKARRLLSKLEKVDVLEIPVDLSIELISAKRDLRYEPSEETYELALRTYHKIKEVGYGK